MHFEKITYDQWSEDSKFNSATREAKEIYYDRVALPKRATSCSAGYDFHAPYAIEIRPHEDVKIPTLVRWICDKTEDKDKVLMIYPRSGLGFSTGMRLMNTVGIIDADYCNADNEGHIFIKMYNPSDYPIRLEPNQAFAQGVITKFYTCDDEDVVTTERTGGMGSTD